MGRMSNRRLTLIQNRRNRKIHRVLAVLFLILLLGIGGYFISVTFSIEGIEVNGLTTYSEEEVINRIENNHYVGNTIAMILLNKLTGETYLPFIEKMTMSYDEPHILKVKVKEGIRAGVFEYMERKVYFDSDGIALESRNKHFDGVPVVTGVKFKKLVLGEKIPVKGDYFDTIVTITKKIATYQLDISRIHFENEDDIYLVSGTYQIYIGSSRYLGSKMSKISETIKSVSRDHKKGVIDMHLYTDEKDIITFHE